SARDERKAFASIRDDLGHLYSFSYYPEPNPNRGWRAINVKLVGEHAKKYHVRTRNGYRPQTNRFQTESAPSTMSLSAPSQPSPRASAPACSPKCHPEPSDKDRRRTSTTP